MDQRVIWAAVAVVVLAGVAAWLYLDREPEEVVEPAALPAPAPAPESAEPEIRHPVPPPEPLAREPEPEPLPPLDESDPVLRERIDSLLETDVETVSPLADDIVRRLVATIDNLPRHKVGPKIRPIDPPAGRFAPGGDDDAPVLNEANYVRYDPLVRIVDAMSPEQLATTYINYYPLFQQAYEELGYPDDYFNDRLVDVIDMLLATPTLEGPVELVRPHVFYEFADPALESLPAGQKLMLRMGPGNAAIVKQKLRELRGLVIAGELPHAGGDSAMATGAGTGSEGEAGNASDAETGDEAAANQP